MAAWIDIVHISLGCHNDDLCREVEGHFHQGATMVPRDGDWELEERGVPVTTV